MCGLTFDYRDGLIILRWSTICCPTNSAPEDGFAVEDGREVVIKRFKKTLLDDYQHFSAVLQLRAESEHERSVRPLRVPRVIR